MSALSGLRGDRNRPNCQQGAEIFCRRKSKCFFCSKKWKWHKSHQRWPQWAKLSIEDEILLQFLNGKVKVTQVSSTFNKGPFHLPIKAHTTQLQISEIWSYLRIVRKNWTFGAVQVRRAMCCQGNWFHPLHPPQLPTDSNELFFLQFQIKQKK